MKRSVELMLLMPLVALILLGCATHDQLKAKVDMPPPALEKPEFIFHKVMPGETMATIAKWYSGNGNQWKAISEQNPGMDPWRLKRDEIVKVPAYLATVHKEQPNFSTAPRPKPKKGSSTAKPGELPVADDADEPVFGPR